MLGLWSEGYETPKKEEFKNSQLAVRLAYINWNSKNLTQIRKDNLLRVKLLQRILSITDDSG